MKRYLNLYFWIPVAALFFTATKIDPVTLTSWPLLADTLMGFIQNPFLIGTFAVALVGIWNNPTTTGLN